MTNITKVVAAEGRFPLSALSLSAMNPRQSVPDADIADLAESIWAVGLLQPMAGWQTEAGVEIVAGGRRLRALQKLAETRADFATRADLAQPLIVLAPDLETAQTWGQVENIARRDLNPAEEIRAYDLMAKSGAVASQIASAFAVTEKHVYRRLSLASLPAAVLDALEAGQISLSAAQCFTISNDEASAIKVLELIKGQSISDYQLKNMLQPKSVTSTDRRAIYVGEDAYKAAGGSITKDLFAEVSLFVDTELLDTLYRDKMEAEAADVMAASGWKWCETANDTQLGYYQIEERKFGRVYPVEGVLSDEQVERYAELMEAAEAEALDEAQDVELATLQSVLDGDYSELQRGVSGFILNVNREGKSVLTGGLIRPEDKGAARTIGVLANAKTANGQDETTETKSPISQTLRMDLNRIEVAARQTAALRQPDLVLALLAFQLSGRMGYYRAFGLSKSDVPNAPTEATLFNPDERILLPEQNPDEYIKKEFAKDFAAFQKKGTEYVMEQLVIYAAQQLNIDARDLAALVDKQTGNAVREIWTPTADNFFGRVGGPYLLTIWRDLLDLAEDDPSTKSFAALKKGEKAAQLERLFTDADYRTAMGVTSKQERRIANWIPQD